MTQHTIYICTTCHHCKPKPDIKERDGYKLLHNAKKLLKKQPQHIQETTQIKSVKCMGGCSQSCAVGFTAPHKQSCLFTHLSPENPEDIFTILAPYKKHPSGRVKYIDLPPKFKDMFLCRIPKAISNKD